MDFEKIKSLEEKIAQEQAKLEAMKARFKEAEKKKDNKRKFLLGSMVQTWMEEDDDFSQMAMDRLDKFLTRDSDRAHFGMGKKKKTSAKKKPGTETN